MKTMVLQLETSNEKIQKKALTKVSGLPGLDQIDLNVNESTLTVKGDIDPVKVMDKLKKICDARIVSLGKEKKEKEEEKKEKKKEEDPEKKVGWNDDWVASFIKTYGYHPATPPYGGNWNWF